MKVSEAIREGSKISLPGKYKLVRRLNGEVYACALGAAYLGSIGTTEVPDPTGYTVLSTTWPELDTTKVDIGGSLGTTSLLSAIIYKNDREDMPREAIADWLEGLGY